MEYEDTEFWKLAKQMKQKKKLFNPKRKKILGIVCLSIFLLSISFVVGAWVNSLSVDQILNITSTNDNPVFYMSSIDFEPSFIDVTDSGWSGTDYLFLNSQDIYKDIAIGYHTTLIDVDDRCTPEDDYVSIVTYRDPTQTIILEPDMNISVFIPQNNDNLYNISVYASILQGTCPSTYTTSINGLE